jgi:hypothetical protein
VISGCYRILDELHERIWAGSRWFVNTGSTGYVFNIGGSIFSARNPVKFHTNGVSLRVE